MGTIVRIWQDAIQVSMAVVVDEDDAGTVEYIGSVPLALYEQLDVVHREPVLLAAVKAVRAAQRVPMQRMLAHTTKRIAL